MTNVNWDWVNEYSWALFALVMIGLIIVLKGFFGAAGKDLYAWAKHKIRPPAPEPIRVNSNYQPKNHSSDLFLWVNEINVADRLSEGYSFYCDPEDGASRFMIHNPSLSPTEKTFYMWRPGENKTEDAD